MIKIKFLIKNSNLEKYKIKSSLKDIGLYEIEAINKRTNQIIKSQVIKNILSNGALDQISNGIYDGSGDFEIKYLAVGTGTQSALVTQTSLISETERFFRTSRTITDHGKTSILFQINEDEARHVITELGIFVGTSATTITDSGTMFSRVTWYYDHTPEDIILRISRVDEIRRY